MEEISEEQQAAMALKLMDNVKQLILDTIMNDGDFAVVVAEIVYQDLVRGGDINHQIDLKIDAAIKNTGQYSPMVKAVKEIVSKQMSF
jgi:hypothetical protein